MLITVFGLNRRIESVLLALRNNFILSTRIYLITLIIKQNLKPNFMVHFFFGEKNTVFCCYCCCCIFTEVNMNMLKKVVKASRPTGTSVWKHWMKFVTSVNEDAQYVFEFMISSTSMMKSSWPHGPAAALCRSLTNGRSEFGQKISSSELNHTDIWKWRKPWKPKIAW